VGYWLGREFWGQGIATQALALFLKEERTRPLVAHVAQHNIGSRRVLEKCGFVVVSAAGMLPMPGADPIPEFTLRLE
jgi:RimJ/RimL family protein N-acetyltransferase